MAGAIFGAVEVEVLLFVAGAAFGDVAVSLFVAGAPFGDVACCNVTLWQVHIW